MEFFDFGKNLKLFLFLGTPLGKLIFGSTQAFKVYIYIWGKYEIPDPPPSSKNSLHFELWTILILAQLNI